MSTQGSIEERVIAVIAKTQHIPPETVTGESTFLELNIDSLDGLQILFALEEEFSIDIPDDAGKQITSVRQAVAGVSELLARKQDAATEQSEPAKSQSAE
jgi:acyl carrier protein